MMRGNACILEKIEDETTDQYLEEAQLNLGEKHNLTENGATIPYSATASGRSRRWIVFTPVTVVSWNNERLESTR